MANIPGNYSKLTDIEISADAAVTESLFYKIGANINELIDGVADLESGLNGYAVFTSNGTWTSPAGITRVVVFGCGGGGGGTYNGGDGAPFLCFPKTVSPSTVYNITIGAGGIGSSTGIGNPGGNTLFDTLLTFKGGFGGDINNSYILPGPITPLNPFAPKRAGGTKGGNGYYPPTGEGYSFMGKNGEGTVFFEGGICPNPASAPGGGGAGIGGNGGNGTISGAGYNGAGFGAGGGGGAGIGGNGYQGLLLVVW